MKKVLRWGSKEVQVRPELIGHGWNTATHSKTSSQMMTVVIEVKGWNEICGTHKWKMSHAD